MTRTRSRAAIILAALVSFLGCGCATRMAYESQLASALPIREISGITPAGPSAYHGIGTIAGSSDVRYHRFEVTLTPGDRTLWLYLPADGGASAALLSDTPPGDPGPVSGSAEVRFLLADPDLRSFEPPRGLTIPEWDAIATAHGRDSYPSMIEISEGPVNLPDRDLLFHARYQIPGTSGLVWMPGRLDIGWHRRSRAGYYGRLAFYPFAFAVDCVLVAGCVAIIIVGSG